MIRWKSLSLPNFFQSKKAEVFLLDPPRMRISKINTIKTASRFEATWHLFVRVPHHVPCVLALFPRSAPDPQVIDPGRNTSDCGHVFIPQIHISPEDDSCPFGLLHGRLEAGPQLPHSLLGVVSGRFQVGIHDTNFGGTDVALDNLEASPHQSRGKRDGPGAVVINAEAAEEHRGEIFPAVGVAEDLVVGEFALDESEGRGNDLLEADDGHARGLDLFDDCRGPGVQGLVVEAVNVPGQVREFTGGLRGR